jgi:hypothetical protein
MCSNSNYGTSVQWHIGTVEIEIAIAIGVEFLAFSSISVPIPIWTPIAAVIIRIAVVLFFGLTNHRRREKLSIDDGLEMSLIHV